MADFEYGEAVGGDHVPRGAFVVALVNWIGALVSVALIAGLGVWGYKLWVRDVSGVPVVRALEGPMRIAPEDPGGMAAEHQGLAVNNIAAEGEAAPPPDMLVLAPRPVKLTPEDQSPAEIAAEQEALNAAEMVAAKEAEAVSAIDQALAEALGSTAEAGEPQAAEVASVMAASLEQAVVAEPEADNEAASAELAVESSDDVDGAVPADVAGVSRSLRPLAKPVQLASLQADAAMAAPGATTASLDVDPETIPVGTRLAQLGAFDTVAVAEAEWTTLAEQFSDVMGGKGRVIQQAQSGGKTFYRLRVAGFEDINDARRFCSVLLAAGASCIPVITR